MTISTLFMDMVIGHVKRLLVLVQAYALMHALSPFEYVCYPTCAVDVIL